MRARLGFVTGWSAMAAVWAFHAARLGVAVFLLAAAGLLAGMLIARRRDD